MVAGLLLIGAMVDSHARQKNFFSHEALFHGAFLPLSQPSSRHQKAPPSTDNRPYPRHPFPVMAAKRPTGDNTPDDDCVDVELDLFTRKLLLDNLLPIYRHYWSGGRSSDDPKFNVILTALEGEPIQQRTAGDVVQYFKYLPDRLETTAKHLRAMNESLIDLASKAARKATAEELVTMRARYRERHPASSAAGAGKSCKCADAASAGGAKTENKETMFVDRLAELEDRLAMLEAELKDRLAMLEAELEAMRLERDMRTPSVLSDSM